MIAIALLLGHVGLASPGACWPRGGSSRVGHRARRRYRAPVSCAGGAALHLFLCACAGASPWRCLARADAASAVASSAPAAGRALRARGRSSRPATASGIEHQISDRPGLGCAAGAAAASASPRCCWSCPGSGRSISRSRSRPAAMGHFFADSFQRRTGKPLTIVTGDPPTGCAGRVGGAEPAQSVSGMPPARSTPPRRPATIARRQGRGGGVAGDRHGRPAAAARIARRFPDLVAEVPRLSTRPVQGRLPLTRGSAGA